LIDPRTGSITREWYLFFYNLYVVTGGGTGITPVTGGGTGLSTIPSNGQLLIGNGNGYTLNTLTASTGITIANGAGAISIANSGVLTFSAGGTGLTPSTGTAGNVALAGTLIAANGGTGYSSYTVGDTGYADTTTTLAKLPIGTTGQVLTVAAGVPSWSSAFNGTVGATTPAAGTFTTLTATGQTSLGGAAGAESLRALNTASTVNWVQTAGGLAGVGPILSVQGSDASVDFLYSAKGTAGSHVFRTNSTTRQFQVNHTTTAVNYMQVTGAITGAGPALSVAGSNADIDLNLTPKGAGNVRFGTYTGTILTPTGYITIKDSGGTSRRLLVG
jgi:hypothetical protein